MDIYIHLNFICNDLKQKRKEFEEHGVSEYATVYHRDASCDEGFQMEDKILSFGSKVETFLII
jgi:hypothetical protein